MLNINHNPSARDLRIFAALLPLFLALLGALRWFSGSPRTAQALWLAAVALAVIVAVFPRLRRRLYVGWMVVLYPVSWLISHIILALIFFVVATPIALLMRATGRDPMKRSFDKGAQSYWAPRPSRSGGKTDPTRYFRQF